MKKIITTLKRMNYMEVGYWFGIFYALFFLFTVLHFKIKSIITLAILIIDIVIALILLTISTVKRIRSKE